MTVKISSGPSCRVYRRSISSQNSQEAPGLSDKIKWSILVGYSLHVAPVLQEFPLISIMQKYKETRDVVRELPPTYNVGHSLMESWRIGNSKYCRKYKFSKGHILQFCQAGMGISNK